MSPILIPSVTSMTGWLRSASATPTTTVFRPAPPRPLDFLFVVAAKSDLEKLVSDEEAKEYCKTVHAEFFSTSAKENIGTPSHLSAHPVGVNELFGSVAKHMIHSKGVDNFTTSMTLSCPSWLFLDGNNQYPYVSSTVMNANEPETKKCCCEVL